MLAKENRIEEIQINVDVYVYVRVTDVPIILKEEEMVVDHVLIVHH